MSQSVVWDGGLLTTVMVVLAVAVQLLCPATLTVRLYKPLSVVVVAGRLSVVAVLVKPVTPRHAYTTGLVVGLINALRLRGWPSVRLVGATILTERPVHELVLAGSTVTLADAVAVQPVGKVTVRL